MLAYECPSCGAPVSFASAASVFAVCPHCRSMVVRSDKKLESIGVMADLLPDTSPLQIGTRGRWKEKTFTLLGRIRYAWAEGSWTEWFFELNDGQQGWLGEAQGFFTIALPVEAADLPKNPRTFEAGSSVSIGGEIWRLMDGKDVRVTSAEGELPFAPVPGIEHYSLDLSGPHGSFGSLDSSPGKLQFFKGEALFFRDLSLENLREVPGWSQSLPETIGHASRTVRCPHCAAAVEIRASGQSLSVVCGSCQTILDPASADVTIIQRAEAALQTVAPVLPLGIRGQFFGHPYEIIGCMVRADTYASWSEYLLFNPWQGFLWLVTYNGHWTVVDRLLAPLQASGGELRGPAGRTYYLFARSQTQVTAVIGEFYWQVQRGEQSEVWDFIAPPHIVSQEKYPTFTEETWSAGTYFQPDEIAAAFQLPHPLPTPQGSYLNQPNPYRERWKKVRWAAAFAVLLLCAVQLVFAVMRPERTILRQDFETSPAAASLTAVAGGHALTLNNNQVLTPSQTMAPSVDSAAPEVLSPPSESTLSTTPFTLSGGSQPVRMEISAQLYNSWIDFDLQLVNSATGEAHAAQTELSYYSGTDADGAWTEDARVRTVDFAGVSPGSYFLRIEPSLDSKALPPHFSVEIRSGGIFWSNFITCLGLLAVYPLWTFYRRYAFERDRWSESDLTPPALTLPDNPE